MSKKIFNEEQEEKKPPRSLNDPEVKKEVIEFGKFIKSIEKQKLDRDISYYGVPLNGKYDGYVVNDILGGVHWTAVKQAEKENMIIKRGDLWAIIGTYDGKAISKEGKVMDSDSYIWTNLALFMNNLRLLRELKNKVEYAKLKSLEGMV